MTVWFLQGQSNNGRYLFKKLPEKGRRVKMEARPSWKGDLFNFLEEQSVEEIEGRSGNHLRLLERILLRTMF